jgi:imidazolonepropionase-like amidohydrolase
LWAAVIAAPFGSSADDAALALVGARLVDGRGEAPSGDTVVVVRGDRIVAVGGPEAIPAGAVKIDLAGKTLLPGLIDTHAHPLIWADDYQTEHLRRSSAYKALRGLEQVQLCLAAGWTTMRYAGDADVYYAVIDVRRAIDEGRFHGPRLTGAGHYISISGGGGDINFTAPEQQLIADGLIVDGVDEMRKAVRNEVKYGSDWIKLMVTGAFMSAGDDPKDVHMSPEELAVAMDEAGRLGVPVMAHAHSTEGIIQAIEAGVRSIEHGTFIDEKGVRLARRRGTYLVPTFYLGDYYIAEIPRRAHAQSAGSREGGCQGRGRYGHGLRQPVDPGAGVCRAGRGRHDAAAGDTRRHSAGRRAARLAGSHRLAGAGQAGRHHRRRW